VFQALVMDFEYRQGGALVRPWTMADAQSLHLAVRGSIATLSHALPWCHADYVLADAEQWIAYSLAGWESGAEYPLGIFDATGEVIGGTGISQLNRAHNLGHIGYWVRDASRGRGVAAAGARAAACLGFDTLGLTRLEIVVLPDNTASLRVAEKLGAVREGLARNRVLFQGRPVPAVVFSLIPGDLAAAPGT
jgi:RimJ/RimL family protein N-acetyltransferase